MCETVINILSNDNKNIELKLCESVTFKVYET
jgi:hypothetical protein